MLAIFFVKERKAIGPFDSMEEIDNYLQKEGITKQQFDPDLEDFWYKNRDGELITVLIGELLPPTVWVLARDQDPHGQHFCEL